MAQYKVPQDVEADDKLLGPFSFRQFVYLMIAGGLIAIMVGLFQLFPVLAIIPAPFILLFGVLALPLRKDQPMETYLVALVSYYLKPKNQLWKAGQRESTIQITAPKIVEVERTRNLTGEEATHRLSFLADIVDTGGQAIKGVGYAGRVNEALGVETMTAQDMFEGLDSDFGKIGGVVRQGEDKRRSEVIQEMRNAIEKNMEEAKSKVAGGAGTDTVGMMDPDGTTALRGPRFNPAVMEQPRAEGLAETFGSAEEVAPAAGIGMGAGVGAVSGAEPKPILRSNSAWADKVREVEQAAEELRKRREEAEQKRKEALEEERQQRAAKEAEPSVTEPEQQAKTEERAEAEGSGEMWREEEEFKKRMEEPGKAKEILRRKEEREKKKKEEAQRGEEEKALRMKAEEEQKKEKEKAEKEELQREEEEFKKKMERAEASKKEREEQRKKKKEEAKRAEEQKKKEEEEAKLREEKEKEEKKRQEEEELRKAEEEFKARIEGKKETEEDKARKIEEAKKAEEAEKAEALAKNPSIIELANNADYTVATIAKEANRIKEKMEGEVFISLH